MNSGGFGHRRNIKFAIRRAAHFAFAVTSTAACFGLPATANTNPTPPNYGAALQTCQNPGHHRGAANEATAACTILINAGGTNNDLATLLYYRSQHDLDDNQQIADLTEAIRLKPDYAEAYLARGDAYEFDSWQWHGGGKTAIDHALADYAEAIHLRPTYAEAFKSRGETYSSLNRYDEAIADFTKALPLCPLQPSKVRDTLYLDKCLDTLWDRAHAYQSLKQYDRAVADLTELIGLAPEFPVGYSDRGSIWLEQKSYDKAIADFTTAIELTPPSMHFDEASRYTYRGAAYLALKKFDLADHDFDEAVGLAPDDPFPLQMRGESRVAQDKYDDAIADFDKVLLLRPHDALVLYLRGRAKTLKGDKSGGDADLMAAKAMVSKLAEAPSSQSR